MSLSGKPVLAHQTTSPVFLSKATKRVPPMRLVAPAGVEHADDDQVAVDDGAGDAAAVAADPAVLLGQRMLPEHLAVLVEAEEQALGAVGVDVAGLRIAGQVGPAEAVADDVGEEDVELVLPEHLAVVGVEAHDPFLLGQPLAGLLMM